MKAISVKPKDPNTGSPSAIFVPREAASQAEAARRRMLEFLAVRRSWRFLAIGILAVAALAGTLVGDRLLALTSDTRDNLRLFTDLVETARARYGRDVTYRDLVYAGVNGMLRTLDPHTSFLPPDAHAQMRERHQASFFGLGILVGLRNGRLTVISPIEGTPASRLGIRAGDIIQSIEGEPTAKMNVDEAVSKLKGPKGTEVHITIVRQGLPDPLELTVVRDEIPQSTVRYAYMIAPGTGYLSITDFSRSTGDEVIRAIAKLRGEGMERMVLDLRNNGGGLLDQAIAVADQFVPAGSAIVETRGRVRDSIQSFDAAGNQPPLNLPLVVLVNAGTASASEIVSGAIQDHDVGLIVGTPTWGKGLVQTVYNLSYGAGLALTTAKYYTPSGRLIQRDYHSYLDYVARTDVDGKDTTRSAAPHEQFSTDLGRKVYGGGGISPDVEAQPKEISPALQYLIGHSAFFRFGVDWGNSHPEVDREWRPDAALVEQFRAWVVAQKLQTEPESRALLADPESRAVVERQLRAEVLSSRFGIEAAHQALADGDAQIQAALGLFPKAASLLAERKGLPHAPEVRTVESLRN
jgi:carboxyl-terminal processing protease